MKKLTALLLCLIMLIPVLALPASAARDTKLVAITFDDGPSKYTDELLDGLKLRGAKATFFMVGTNIDYHKDIVKRMKDEGHQIATHTMSHANLAKLDAAGVQKEVTGVEEKLDAILGKGDYYLRPPYGSYNATVKKAANTPLIYWSVDTEDWRYRDASNVARVIMNSTRDGAIILLHDLYKTSVDGALMAIDSLQSQGYVFVTVEQLLKRRGITPENGTVYFEAPNKGINLPAVVAPVIATRTTVLGTKVVIGKFDRNDMVYFTKNGDTPDDQCDIYQSPYYIAEEQSIKAIAVGESEISDIAEKGAAPSKMPPKEILDIGFYRYKIAFFDLETKFVPGMNI